MPNCAGLPKVSRKLVHKRTYKSWGMMRARCSLNNRTKYPRHAGRNITCCERWRSYELFLEDMGERPEFTSLDRINNDGNYEPGNCRWATRSEQSRNRANVNYNYLEFDGQRMLMSDWAKKLGVIENSIYSRLERGWSIEKTLSTPMRPLSAIEYNGKVQTKSEWAREYGISVNTLTARLKVCDIGEALNRKIMGKKN